MSHGMSGIPRDSTGFHGIMGSHGTAPLDISDPMGLDRPHGISPSQHLFLTINTTPLPPRTRTRLPGTVSSNDGMPAMNRHGADPSGNTSKAAGKLVVALCGGLLLSRAPSALAQPRSATLTIECETDGSSAHYQEALT